MKGKKHIFCFCNLVFFLSSFLLFSYVSLQATVTILSADHVHAQITQSTNAGALTILEQLAENNETESESDFELGTFLLPFFISQFLQQIYEPQYHLVRFIAATASKPIFLSIRHFRI